MLRLVGSLCALTALLGAVLDFVLPRAKAVAPIAPRAGDLVLLAAEGLAVQLDPQGRWHPADSRQSEA